MRKIVIFIISGYLILMSFNSISQNSTESKLIGTWICYGNSVDDNLMINSLSHTTMISFYDNSIFQIQNTDTSKSLKQGGNWKVVNFGKTILFKNKHIIINNNSTPLPIEKERFNFNLVNDTMLILYETKGGIETLYHYKKSGIFGSMIPDSFYGDIHIIHMPKQQSESYMKRQRNPKSTYKLGHIIKKYGHTPAKPNKKASKRTKSIL